MIACAALCALAPGCGGGAARPPSALLVVVDTWRADRLSLYGHQRPTTPWLDDWARELGVVFDAARSSAPWTKPSVASMLTGLDPRQHQVRAHPDRLNSALATLAEAFADAGYQTAAFQSNVLLASVFGYDQGFEHYDELHLAGYKCSTGPALNAAALAWLDGRERARPFFLYLHHYEPHFDYTATEVDFDPGYAGPLDGSEEMDALIGAAARLTPADVAHLAARYDAELVRQDRLLSDFWAGLEQRGLAGEVVIALAGDHGEEFLDHGSLSHDYELYEELERVPLVIARPHEPRAGARVAADVSLVDLGRTLLDACGLAARPFPGASLVPLMDGAAQEPRAILAESLELRWPLPGGGFASRDMLVQDGWKLVRHPDGSRALYDLARDPGERADRAAEERARMESMESEIERLLAERAAQAPVLAAERIELSAEQIEELAKLGYLAGS
jgi:arylsulfatase A-like enzyme